MAINVWCLRVFVHVSRSVCVVKRKNVTAVTVMCLLFPLVEKEHRQPIIKPSEHVNSVFTKLTKFDTSWLLLLSQNFVRLFQT